MKRSPLSTPGGSSGKQNYNWKSYNHKNRTGYNYVKSDGYQCTSPKGGNMQTMNDFIPLNISTPVSEKKWHNANWRNSEGSCYRNNGGYNYYKNNHYAIQKSNYNNSYSPYKHSNKPFHGQKKGHQRDSRKHVNISNYIDMKSFLEDPWAELTRKLQKEEANRNESASIEQSSSSQLLYRDSQSSCESKSLTGDNISLLLSKSGEESSINDSFGAIDTDTSNVSKTESSLDLKLDSVRFSLESKNESVCDNKDVCPNDIDIKDNTKISSISNTNNRKSYITITKNKTLL